MQPGLSLSGFRATCHLPCSPCLQFQSVLLLPDPSSSLIFVHLWVLTHPLLILSVRPRPVRLTALLDSRGFPSPASSLLLSCPHNCGENATASLRTTLLLSPRPRAHCRPPGMGLPAAVKWAVPFEASLDSPLLWPGPRRSYVSHLGLAAGTGPTRAPTPAAPKCHLMALLHQAESLLPALLPSLSLLTSVTSSPSALSLGPPPPPSCPCLDAVLTALSEAASLVSGASMCALVRGPGCWCVSAPEAVGASVPGPLVSSAALGWHLRSALK